MTLFEIVMKNEICILLPSNISTTTIRSSFQTSDFGHHRRRKVYNIRGAKCSSVKTDRAQLGRLLGGSGGMLPQKSFEF